MPSPVIAAALDAWRKGYSPTDAARKYFRQLFRNELEGEVAQLLMRLEAANELQAAVLAREFAANVGRLDAQLRRNLSGDRHPGDEQAAPIRRAV